MIERLDENTCKKLATRFSAIESALETYPFDKGAVYYAIKNDAFRKYFVVVAPAYDEDDKFLEYYKIVINSNGKRKNWQSIGVVYTTDKDTVSDAVEKNIGKIKKANRIMESTHLKFGIQEEVLCTLDALQKGRVEMVLGDNIDKVSIEGLALLKEIYKDEFKIYKLLNYNFEPLKVVKLKEKLGLSQKNQLPNSTRIGNNLMFFDEQIDGNYELIEIYEDVDAEGLEKYNKKVFGKYKKDSVELKTPQEIRNLVETLGLNISPKEEKIQ